MRRGRRRQLGQHFLRDVRVAEAMAAALPSLPPRVLEVGPGKGALTTQLLARFPRVHTVELDPVLAATLQARLGEPSGLEVTLGDALQMDLDAFAGEGPWSVAANLPYSVATPIVRRLLWAGETFPVLVVMVQKEVALRMLAPPGNAERGALSVEVQLLAEGELLFTVPPRCFFPPPKVVSAVVRLRPRALVEREAVHRAVALARRAFCHRRKKLVNALAGVMPNVEAWLAAAEIPAHLRPQELGEEQWLTLARTWEVAA
ncbi:MAG: 16S rRNA (adenine(1518)-N(6)/adenine(1519)-N(6))-dimethyltransferase RsmA [Thermoanaerobaculum sp.]|nr:16S rRNA (adenine(1518)-N(6)/adenine(1519)-N(6))-dimethyltransferase RsmA [Thermoanaerobaculum sp.]MCX7895315.1 16S rRNA (adenine(1518)-N(6)/adenine(1519)-N(6))-dimethyltransferase RsmA [Thermoanaerobaculum sp.]MDW7968413.1 16S rRNA (adenine(1518)-N(6)/adenine(1519)-N(6))-dimethyltransferase RsmA [Thermoanaerobaculum sp.]